MARKMNRTADRKIDEHRRTVLAQEAARLICEHGIDDYRSAKTKAAENLGLRNYGALPNNREIESALAERNRIFGGAENQQLLDSLRTIALSVMYELQLFEPCLVGPVLSGVVTEHSAINLHLFSDASENVSMRLSEQGIRHSSVLKRHRLGRCKIEQYPGYRFFADDFAIDATVFPERNRAQAPLSPVDGRPMKRAKLRDVERLAY
jgi:hypothetical protein